MASYDYGKTEVVNWLKNNFSTGDTCLDVGACDGKWHSLVGSFFIMDGVEIFQPNIDKYNLTSKYHKVFNMNITDFQYPYYDCVIFGDVIEHLTIEDAQYVLNYANGRCKDLIIAVPFLYKQDESYGNKWEKHIQDDLTAEIFNQRYPGYIPIWINDQYAYYHKNLDLNQD